MDGGFGLIRNHLLAALPTEDFKRISPHLELVEMPQGEILHEPGGLMHYAYFPTTAVVSMACLMKNGTSSEITDVGNEGLVGTYLFMDKNAPPSLAVVDIGGFGYRLKARKLMEEFQRDGTMQRLLLRYIQALITQVAQTAVCNRHHSVGQQLSRWLLHTLDRVRSSEFAMTQELIARMLGVRREGVSEAAGQLQRAGCIRYHRGHITVLDRTGLEAHACECYAVVKNEFSRLFAGTRGHQPSLSANYADRSLRLPVFRTGKADSTRSLH